MPLGGGGTGFGGVSVGGGGGGAVPKNIVVGSSLSTANIEIDGLSGSPDAVPASPSASNDEFNQNTSGTPAGWTEFNAAQITTIDTTTALSHLNIAGATTGSVHWMGVYKAVPAIPFTVTAALSDMCCSPGQGAGVFIAGTNPGTGSIPMCLCYLNGETNNMEVFAQKWTDYETFGSTQGSQVPGSAASGYLRIIVTSTTSITYQWSPNGLVWQTLDAAFNPSFTPSTVGVAISTGATAPQGMFDWIRFT